MSAFTGDAGGFAWPVVLLAFVTIGHFGLFVAFYNRLNALGIPRRTIKCIEWCFFAICLVIPALVYHFDGHAVAQWITYNGRLADVSLMARVYALVCLASMAYPGLPWLLYRPIFGLEWVRAETQTLVVDVADQVDGSLAKTVKCQVLACIPGNQIFDLAIERKTLPVPGLPKELDGLQIAHLSDIHLTGHVDRAFYAYAMEQANQWQPDLVFLTGDVVDKAACIAWLPDCFAHAQSTHGQFFILGNHDLRVPDPSAVRRTMQSIGWADLGGRLKVENVNGCAIRVIGNESPWFPAPQDLACDPRVFSIACCHSPDQLPWARRLQIPLVLAGHTHGGQGRLPLAGPILSPSRFGSRYASGEFYVAPTTMHVTRGLSGAHLMRIHCRPELALLTLKRPVAGPAVESG